MTDRKHVQGGFIIEQEHLPGRCYVLTGPWSERSAQTMREEGAAYLRLNRTLGARFENLEFLEELADLRGVEIYDPTVTMKQLAPLLKLEHLDLLGLQCKLKDIDFAACFPRLRLVSFRWRAGCESVFRCARLEFLFVEGYPYPELTSVQPPSALRRLHVNSKHLERLEGVAGLAALEHLTLAYCSALSDISALAGTRGLRVLEIHNSKRVSDLTALTGLRQLRRLVIENGGEIVSLQTLAGCEALEEVYLPGTQVRDGDLSALLALPHLSRTAFPRNRRYSHSMDQINALLAARR